MLKNFENELDQYINKEILHKKLLDLKEGYLCTNKNNLSRREIYILALDILEDLFNPMKLYKEPIIPLSFIQSTIGKVILSIINDNEKRLITIHDLVEMSKSSRNNKGYTLQYIYKLIKKGEIKAVMINGRWQVSYEEAIEFLKRKGVITDT